ncbi:uncharacterized protein LOC132951921 isoform X2 [Metopolophium dirhodum]|uniref:uncharacterized protein LOC132951921 isoform X2 n=1 Tax=Metopolophium dirhodum TaxID=44670 RepID=UPI00299019C6|nr:uncharacterized protein LOC132951921 isoform X2 [Metopolophium dirhodum]
MLMMLLTPRLLVTVSVLLAVTDGGRGPTHPVGKLFDDLKVSLFLFQKKLEEYFKEYIPGLDVPQNSSELVISVLGQDRGRLIPSAPAERNGNSLTQAGNSVSLSQKQHKGNYSMFLEDINVTHQKMYFDNSRYDDDNKALLALQQSEPHSQKLLFDRMLFKIIDSLRTLTNETIAVQELLKGDIPREDESQNSSELIQNCTHHIEQIQNRMLTFKDQQKNVLEPIVEFEQAYKILKESWKTKLEKILSRTYYEEARKFLNMFKKVRPLRDTRGPPENIREKTRTADKIQYSSKSATTLRQALAQLYIQDHVKLEITHQIDNFQKQMRLFEDQQIKAYDSIMELEYEYKLLKESWKAELKSGNIPIETVYHKLYNDIQLLRSTDHDQEIIMKDTLKLEELQVSSELAMPLQKLRKRLIFLTDPFKWEHSIWRFQSNESRKSDYLTLDLKQNNWLIFKQIDPQLKWWRLVATTVPETTLGKAHGRVEPTDSGSPMMHSTWTFLGKFSWNDTNCDLQQCGWLVFNQTDPLLKCWRLVVSSPIRIEGQQNPSEPHTTLEKSHSYEVPTVPIEIASGLPQSLEDVARTTTIKIDPLLVDELQDPMNPIKLGQGHGLLVLSKPVEYEDMLTGNVPVQTSRGTQFKLQTPRATMEQEKELQATKNHRQ